MIDPKTVIEGLGVVAKLKGMFRNDAEKAEMQTQPQESGPNLSDVDVLPLGLTTEHLAMLGITFIAFVAIIAIAVVAAQRSALQA